MPRPYRWPIVAGVMLALPLYVLSEAPLVRLTGDVPFGGWWCVYKPVDWLIDETPLDDPLGRWNDVWGVRNEFWAAQLTRMLDDGPSSDSHFIDPNFIH